MTSLQEIYDIISMNSDTSSSSINQLQEQLEHEASLIDDLYQHDEETEHDI